MANILDPTDTAANARMQKTVQDAMVVQDSTPLGASTDPPPNTNMNIAYQNYTDEDLAKGKVEAGKEAICAALQKDPNATQFKYGGSMYNIPQGYTC